jgi:hypothetical protein
MSTSENRRKTQDLKVEAKSFMGVNNFKYLRNMLSNGNRNDNCVKEMIQAGNRAYFANLRLLKSMILSRAAKLQVYKTLIRPVVTYGAETWTLTVKEENILRIFERKIIRKIYGPAMENNSCRIRYNEEISKVLKREDIVRFIKSQRIRWLGHGEKMEDNAVPKRMLKGRLYSKRRKGRPRMRWLEEVENDL